MAGPGRSCPIAYRYRPEDLAGPPIVETRTLYVVGGLYGNTHALAAVHARAAAESSPPAIVFNGDFHYLDTDPDLFSAVEAGVHAHHATLGNVEYAMTTDDDTVGCGCDYPDYVPEPIVANSNLVLERLRTVADPTADVRARLAALPRHLTARIGGLRVAIVHGDPENLAGWRLALEALDPPDERARAATGFTGPATTSDTVADWCRRAGVRVLCCTHTGLPYLQDHTVDDMRYLVVNNGCAGLPNFSDRRFGVMTRLSTEPRPPEDGLYGTALDGLRVDAVPVRYDHGRWSDDFLRCWPPGSPGHENYAARIDAGTWLTVEHARRLSG